MSADKQGAYFGTAEELKAMSKRDDAWTAYVILQNETLHAKVDRLYRRVKEVEREKERAGEDAERSERAKTCIRGMLHNEIEKAAALDGANGELCFLADSSRRAASRVALVHALQTVFGLAAHAASLALVGGPAPSAFLLAAHLGNAAVAGWLCYRAVSASLADWEGRRERLEKLRGDLEAASRGTARLHEVVDEM